MYPEMSRSEYKREMFRQELIEEAYDKVAPVYSDPEEFLNLLINAFDSCGIEGYVKRVMDKLQLKEIHLAAFSEDIDWYEKEYYENQSNEGIPYDE